MPFQGCYWRTDMRLRRLIPLFTFLLVIGCTKENAVESTPPGALRYQAYDTAGTLLISGWLTLTIRDSAHIDGEWHFEKVNDAHNSGPQSGNGHLVGAFQEDVLSIDLNPGYIDNNVLLSGHLTQTAYDGTWTWIGFPGILNRGRFHAKGNQ
jgi:hypothetical protein